MRRPGPRILAGLGLLTLGCASSRHLEVQVGPRTSADLHAEARLVEGQWRVELRLPAGTWTVEPQEGQQVVLVPGEPSSTLRWTVARDRWAQQDRPFRFDLVGQGGLRLSYAVRYPSSLPGGAFLLDVWRVLSGR